MSEVEDLYQEMILEHAKRPRNFGPLDGHSHHAVGRNALCGDHLKVYLILDGDLVKDIHFEGDGCAVSKSSASLMTEALLGKTVAEADALFAKFHAVVTGQPDASADGLGKLAVFSGMSKFPVRVKCATLSWRTVQAALHQKSDPVSTE